MIKLRSAGAALIVALFVALALFTTGAFAQSAQASKTSKSVTAHSAVIVHTHAVRPFGAFRVRSARAIGVRSFGAFRTRAFGAFHTRFRVRSFGFARFHRGARVYWHHRIHRRYVRAASSYWNNCDDDSINVSSFAGFGGCGFGWGCCDSCGWGAFGW
jgi:hypothetical protein